MIKPLYRERYVVLLPPGHPLAEQPQLPLTALDRQRYIDRSACELRDQMVALCSEHDVDLYASGGRPEVPPPPGEPRWGTGC